MSRVQWASRRLDFGVLRLIPLDSRNVLFKPNKVAKSTGQRVPVKMTPQLRAVLDRAKAISKVKGMHVIHKLNGKPVTYRDAYSAWVRACERATPPVEDANIHDMRHRSLTDAKRQGRDAQGLGGHADPSMTEQYIEHLTIEWIEPPELAAIGGAT